MFLLAGIDGNDADDLEMVDVFKKVGKAVLDDVRLNLLK